MGLKTYKNQSVYVAPAFGELKPVNFTILNKMKVGIHEVEKIILKILEFPKEVHYHGLLAMNFLRNFRFTIAPDTATLVLRRIPKI